MGSAVKFINGRAYKKAELLEDKSLTPVLRVGNLFTNSSWYYSDLQLDPDKYIDNGDLIYAWSASFGPRIWDGGHVIYHYHIWKLVLDQVVDKNYLYYFLLDKRNVIGETDLHGSTMKHITKTNMEHLSFPLPPLIEQQRIAAKIAQLFALLRKVESSTQQYAELQTLLKSRVLDLAMRGKLVKQDPNDEPASVLLEKIKAEKAELVKEKKIKKSKPLPPITDEEKPFDIPDSWEWVRLGDLTKKVGAGNTPKGGSKSDVYVNNGVKFIREMNVYNDGLHSNGMVYIRPELAKKREGSAVYAKDILLNITGGSLGRTALIDDNFDLGNVNQHVLIIRNINTKIRKYMHLFLCSSLAQNNIHNRAVGDKAGFSATKTKNLVMPLPPIEEQSKIVSKVYYLLKILSK